MNKILFIITLLASSFAFSSGYRSGGSGGNNYNQPAQQETYSERTYKINPTFQKKFDRLKDKNAAEYDMDKYNELEQLQRSNPAVFIQRLKDL